MAIRVMNSSVSPHPKKTSNFHTNYMRKFLVHSQLFIGERWFHVENFMSTIYDDFHVSEESSLWNLSEYWIQNPVNSIVSCFSIAEFHKFTNLHNQASVTYKEIKDFDCSLQFNWRMKIQMKSTRAQCFIYHNVGYPRLFIM